MSGDLDAMMLHSADHMEAFSIVTVAWQWLAMATAATRAARDDDDRSFLSDRLAAARYWVRTEVSRVAALAALCRSCEGSYGSVTLAEH